MRSPGQDAWRFAAALTASAFVLGAYLAFCLWPSEFQENFRARPGIQPPATPPAVPQDRTAFPSGGGRLQVVVESQADISPAEFPAGDGFDPAELAGAAELFAENGESVQAEEFIREASETPTEASARKLLQARANFEANRRLQMLTRKYQLTREQQALMWPVLVRAAPASARLWAVPAAPGSAGLAAAPAEEPSGDSLAAESTAADSSPEQVARLAAGDQDPDDSSGEAGRTTNKAKAGQDAGDLQAALDASLDMLEPELAPFLDAKQLAMMNEEEIDRYYWWGEVLLRLSGEDAADAVASAADSAGSGVAAEAVSDVEPAAHQGGNLFDILGGQP